VLGKSSNRSAGIACPGKINASTRDSSASTSRPMRARSRCARWTSCAVNSALKYTRVRRPSPNCSGLRRSVSA